ncbi:major facilitator superfamily-domain-containing protein [Daldinia sp. FL1419]|nr:major facilitator superfamily-domain-containing protein [Daldinia sp. FL1419]
MSTHAPDDSHDHAQDERRDVTQPTSSSNSDGENQVNGENKEEPDVPHFGKVKLTLILIALCLAVFLAALDAVIITPALPSIIEDLGASNSAFGWIASAYLVALSAAAPLWGKISDIFGRKPVLILANVIFLVGSLVAALSKDLGMLLAARAVQGSGGGGLITLVEISVGDMFSQRERGLFYGIYGLVWAFATAIGPIIGGAFTTYVTWRWCFWFNLPFDGLSLIITILFLEVHNPKTPLRQGFKAIDWVGSVLVTGSTLMLLFGLEYGGVDYPWGSPTVICLIVFGVVCYAVFGIYERYARYPIIPRRIFGSFSAVSTFGVVFCHGIGFMAPCYFLPLYFQTALGASPIQSGVWFLPLAIAFTVAGITTGIFIQRTGHYLWIIRGSMALLTLSTGLLILLDEHRNWAKIIIFQILLAFGIGANMQTLVICIQALVPPEDIGVATATLNFVRNVATTISIVIGQVLYGALLAKKADALLDAGLPDHTVQDLVNGGSISNGAEIRSSLNPSQLEAYNKAIADSFSIMWIMFTAICAVGLAITFGIRKTQLSTSHEMTKTGLDAEEEKRKKYKQKKQGEGDLAVNGEKAERP